MNLAAGAVAGVINVLLTTPLWGVMTVLTTQRTRGIKDGQVSVRLSLCARARAFVVATLGPARATAHSSCCPPDAVQGHAGRAVSMRQRGRRLWPLERCDDEPNLGFKSNGALLHLRPVEALGGCSRGRAGQAAQFTRVLCDGGNCQVHRDGRNLPSPSRPSAVAERSQVRVLSRALPLPRRCAAARVRSCPHKHLRKWMFGSLDDMMQINGWQAKIQGNSPLPLRHLQDRWCHRLVPRDDRQVVANGVDCGISTNDLRVHPGGCDERWLAAACPGLMNVCMRVLKKAQDVPYARCRNELRVCILKTIPHLSFIEY